MLEYSNSNYFESEEYYLEENSRWRFSFYHWLPFGITHFARGCFESHYILVYAPWKTYYYYLGIRYVTIFYGCHHPFDIGYCSDYKRGFQTG